MHSKHAELNKWVKDMAKLCRPDRIVWIDGSDEEKEKLEKECFAAGELIPLEPAISCRDASYHRTNPNDVARTEHLTYICTRKKTDAGPNNNWMKPNDAYQKAREMFNGSMKGRTMYVIPFSMGPVGSPFSARSGWS